MFFFVADHRASSPPHLEPEVTITASTTATNTASSSKKSSHLPVLHIPEYIPTSCNSSFGGSVHKKTKKPPLTASSTPAPASTGGHPGMPNGLLRLSTSLQPRAGTTVTPKDQNAKLGKGEFF